MKRFLLMVAVTSVATLLSPQAAAQPDRSRFDVFSILATTGGYYVRTISPKGDRITARCSLTRKGGWDFAVAVYPAEHSAPRERLPATLTLSNRWAYSLRSQSDGGFAWRAPNSAAFALFLRRASGMGWGDRFVSHELGIDHQSHGSDDAATLSAFAHLCRLPEISPNAY